MSSGLTVKLLKEVLPIHDDLSTTAIQRQVRRTAERLEAERGEPREGGVRDDNALLEPSVPWIVGLDGAYVHAKGVREADQTELSADLEEILERFNGTLRCTNMDKG